MNFTEFSFAGTVLHAYGSGALHWPDQNLLCVSDLHLGKSERMSRRSGIPAPPYEVQDTLARLESDIAKTQSKTVICLGDSFDDLAAMRALPDAARLWIARLQAGRDWIWIEGNHDPGPIDLGGQHLAEWRSAPLVFRHIAEAEGMGEISGHYHPKVRLQTRGKTISRRAFLLDDQRLILPAYGTYTGGLRSDDANLCALMAVDARAIMTGPKPIMVPMPRGNL